MGKVWAGALSNVLEDKEAPATAAALRSPSSPQSLRRRRTKSFRCLQFPRCRWNGRHLRTYPA